MKYTTVLFDLDGTLLNTIDDLTDSLNYIMKKYGYSTYEVDQVLRFVGNGLRNLMKLALPQGESNPRFEEILADYIAYYNTHNKIKTAPYEGIMDVVKKLDEQGVGMAIVTNKVQAAAESLLQEMFFPYIKVVVGDDPSREKKPHPDNVNEALKQLGVTDKSKVLYIGDSEVDAQTAINSDLDYLLCMWGFRNMDDLKDFNPLSYVNNPEEILGYVL